MPQVCEMVGEACEEVREKRFMSEQGCLRWAEDTNPEEEGPEDEGGSEDLQEPVEEEDTRTVDGLPVRQVGQEGC